jgi:membrane-associated HD superfamily phosphohydrolase
MFVALLGVLIGTAIFAGFFWSVAQAFRQDGTLRWMHILLIALTLVGMACISLSYPTIALGVGSFLTLTALATIVAERGWNRLLPLTQVAFGLTLGLGLPFA